MTNVPNPGPHFVEPATAEAIARELPAWVTWYRTERFPRVLDTVFVFETRKGDRVHGISYAMSDFEEKERAITGQNPHKHRYAMNELAIASARPLPFYADATVDQRVRAFSMRDLMVTWIFYELVGAAIAWYRMQWLCRTAEGRSEGDRLRRTGRLHKLLCPCPKCCARRMALGVP